MAQPQPAVFAEGTQFHWFLHYRLVEGADLDALRAAIRSVKEAADEGPPTEAVNLVTAFGDDLLRRLAPDLVPDGHRPFTTVGAEPGPVAVATQEDLFFWAHGNRHDRNYDVAVAAHHALAGLATLARETQGWVYHDSRDLSGFIDGTENPAAEEARELAVVSEGPGEGGSFVLTQRYIHDLDAFHALPVEEQEAAVGRTKPDSEELDPMPATAHVGRVVMEDEDGEEIEIYRRSVPYGVPGEAGLYFLAFTDDLDKIAAMLDRMYGVSGDGVHDRLMDFTHTASGSYYFAPSVDALHDLLGDG